MKQATIHVTGARIIAPKGVERFIIVWGDYDILLTASCYRLFVHLASGAIEHPEAFLTGYSLGIPPERVTDMTYRLRKNIETYGADPYVLQTKKPLMARLHYPSEKIHFLTPTEQEMRFLDPEVIGQFAAIGRRRMVERALA